jgi:hypothetical protein
MKLPKLKLRKLRLAKKQLMRLLKLLLGVMQNQMDGKKFLLRHQKLL